MKMTTFERVAFLILLFGLTGPNLAPIKAATTNQPGSPMPAPLLDNDEMVQLKHVREQVLSANPDLKAEEEKLKTLHDSMQSAPAPTAEQKNAAYAEWKAYQKKMRAAMLKVDPTLAPIFKKLDSARKHGAPPPFQPATKSD